MMMNPRMARFWTVSVRNKSFYFNNLGVLQLAQQDQDQQHHQNHAADPQAGMAHTIAIAAKSAAKAAQQENDHDDDEYRSKRHGAPPETLLAASKTPRGP